MKSTKIISLLLAAMILSSCSIISERTIDGGISRATSASGGVERPNVTAVSGSHYQSSDNTAKTPQEALEELPVFDCDGSIFLVATIDDATQIPIFPSEGAASANVVTRFTAIEERYNVKITPYKYTYEELVAELAESVITDRYIVDLVIIPANKTSAFDENGAMLNPNRLAFFDFDRSYFDKAYSKGYGSYAICGDALMKPENTLCVYYNTEIAQKLGIGLLYDEFASGRWTWELLTEYASKGWITSDIPLSYPIALTSGLSYADILSRDGTIKELDPEEYADTVRTIDNLKKYLITNDPLTTFKNGGALFYIGTLDDISKLGGMKNAWSPMPLPNAFAGVKEYTPIRDFRANDYVFMIPKYPYSVERSTQIVTAFCAASEQFKQSLKDSIIPQLRVNEARLLIDIILG